MVVKKFLSRSFKSIAERVRHSGIARRRSSLALYSIIRQRGLEIAYLLALFTLSAGIFNTLLEGSRYEGSGQIILRFRAAQTFTEFLINFFTLLVGTGGVYLIYLSGRQTFRHRLTTLYMLLGFAGLLIAVAVGVLTLQTKGY